MTKKPLGVLLVHGFTASPKNIIALEAPLNELGLPTRAPLLHGHGADSPEALRNSTWRDWLADGEDALKDLLSEAEKAIIVGHSMGGLVALNLAADYSRSIDSIVLAAAAVYLTNILAPGRALNFLAPLYAAIIKKVDMPPVYVEQAQAQFDPNYAWSPTPPILSLFEFARLTRARLQEVNVPALIVNSRKDGTVATESAQIIFDGLATAGTEKSILWFEKTEHEMFLDIERHVVIKAIVDYIKSRLD